MNKSIFFILISVLIAIWQISFLHEFVFFSNYLNFVLVLVVFITVMNSFKNGFTFALITGLTLDLYSSFSFGLITATLITTSFLIYILFQKIITQKTAYSLLMVIIFSTIFYHLFLWLSTNLFYWLNWHTLTITLSVHYLYLIIGQILLHILIIMLIWLLTKFIIQGIRSRFLISGNS